MDDSAFLGRKYKLLPMRLYDDEMLTALIKKLFKYIAVKPSLLVNAA